MNREFARALLTDNRELFKIILAYNQQFQSKDSPLAAYPALESALSEHYHLKRRLTRQDPIYCDFESFANRLVLLPDEIFSTLEKMVSACICTTILQNGILKHSVKLYKDLLGEANYYFGLERGRFYIATALKEKIVAEFGSSEEALSRSGIWALNLCASEASDFCKSQLEIGNMTELMPHQTFSADERKILDQCIAKIIIKEIDPACQNILR
ncbi:MAG: hypothetical protein K6F05_00770 [Succinivibrio sp.]|nr:hypothetical protein [Succinivibrio sp.]